MTQTDAPRRVVAFIYDGLCTFEYGIAAEIFGLNRPELGRELYTFSSVAMEDGDLRAAGGLLVQATGTATDLVNADIIIVPGWRGAQTPVPENILIALRAASARGADILTICSGVFVLAAAGLLKGRPATTHWRYTDELKAQYPDIDVQPNALYVQDGGVITSAGSSAGIDACLYLVRRDFGAQIANSVARRLVMHAHRQGGQAQFIEQPVPRTDSSHKLSAVMDQVRNNLSAPYDIGQMAEMAGMSSRTFQRRFQAFAGQPAMQWLIQERTAQAARLLETTEMSVEQVCYAVGFPNAEGIRYHFRQTYQISPGEYRKRFLATA